jgi:hypothetical protein
MVIHGRVHFIFMLYLIKMFTVLPLLIFGLCYLLFSTCFIHNYTLYYRRFMVLNDIDMLFPINVNHMVVAVAFNSCGLAT